MRDITALKGIASRYFTAAKQHQAEYAQMRDEAWHQIPGFEKSSEADRESTYAARANELATAELTIDTSRQAGGTSAKTPVKLTTSVGKEHTNFKYRVDAFTRQEAQTRVSLAIDEPVTPIARRHLERDGALYDGWVKSDIPTDEKLGIDPTKWTRHEIRELLVGAVLSELLGNYDTKADQYKVVNGHAINADLDIAMRDLGWLDRALDRHTQGTYTPPAVNLLYRAYVRGEVQLDESDFGAMFDAIARLQAIPRGEYEAMIAEALPDDAVRARVMEQRDTLHLDIANLIEDLKDEKSERDNGTLGLFRSSQLGARDRRLLGRARRAESRVRESVTRLGQRLSQVIHPVRPVGT